MGKLSSLDILTSAKNEGSNLVELYQRVSRALEKRELTWRLIICDNDSVDNTWAVIEELASGDPRVLGVKMSRDFGFEGAITGALSLSNADAVVMMASDLQDPPEAITILVDEFESGFDHVFQVVSGRPDSGFIRRLNSRLFYKVAFKLSRGMIYPDSSIFRIISRDMVSQLSKMGERNRFTRALVMYLGYRTKAIPIERERRSTGKSKASTRHALALGIKGILANSYGLLDLVGYFGIIVSGIATLTTMVFAFVWIFVGVPFAGFGLIIGLILLGFGFTFLALGIMAQYLSLIYEEVKARPNYVIMKTTQDSK